MQLGGSVRDDSLSPNCEQSLSVYAQLFIAAPVVCVCIRALGAITRRTSLCCTSCTFRNSIPHSLRGRTTPSVQTAGAGAAASVDLACAVTRALIFNVACRPRGGAGERAARARKGPPSTLLYMVTDKKRNYGPGHAVVQTSPPSTQSSDSHE